MASNPLHYRRANDRNDHEHAVWAYRFALPFMYTLAFYVQVEKAVYRAIGADITINSMIVDGVSKNSRQLKEGAARWPDLDTCYNFIEGEGPTRLHQAIDA